MNTRIRQQLARRKRRLQRRLDKTRLGDIRRPVLSARNIHYEIAERAQGMAHGGIGAFHLLARRLGLIEAIDCNLHLLTVHLPYHESDHVLTLAYNALCGGECLQDIEQLRQDVTRTPRKGSKADDLHFQGNVVETSKRLSWQRQRWAYTRPRQS